MMLNPIIKGWGNYYKYGTSANVFHRMDWEIFKKIWHGQDADIRRNVKDG